MKLNDFITLMESIAPKSLAVDFDNVGLLIGPDHDELRKVLVALDCTQQTAEEAIETGADMLLTHHPVFFNGIKRFIPDDPDNAAAYKLARNGIGLFAAHTNLDAVGGGVNDALAQTLGLNDAVPFGDGMGRIGEFSQETELRELARFVEKELETTALVCGNCEKKIRRVALLGGAGAFAIQDARLAGADVLITGECKHHEALSAQAAGFSLIIAGHYETERVVLSSLIKRLQRGSTGVQYNLTHRETACLRRV